MTKRKEIILVSVLDRLSNDDLFNILRSNKYSLSTLRSATRILNKRGVYG